MTLPGAVCGGMVRSLFGESEVKNFHAIIAGDEDDIWLEIAMNDSFLVSGGKPSGISSTHSATARRGSAPGASTSHMDCPSRNSETR